MRIDKWFLVSGIERISEPLYRQKVIDRWNLKANIIIKISSAQGWIQVHHSDFTLPTI